MLIKNIDEKGTLQHITSNKKLCFPQKKKTGQILRLSVIVTECLRTAQAQGHRRGRGNKVLSLVKTLF